MKCKHSKFYYQYKSPLINWMWRTGRFSCWTVSSAESYCCSTKRRRGVQQLSPAVYVSYMCRNNHIEWVLVWLIDFARLQFFFLIISMSCINIWVIFNRPMHRFLFNNFSESDSSSCALKFLMKASFKMTEVIDVQTFLSFLGHIFNLQIGTLVTE